jgi:nucleoid-associated protein YejK
MDGQSVDVNEELELRPTDFCDIKPFASWYRISSDSLQYTPDAFCGSIFVVGRIL